MHVCMYIRMYACVCVRLCVCVCTAAICVHIHVYIYIHVVPSTDVACEYAVLGACDSPAAADVAYIYIYIYIYNNVVYFVRIDPHTPTPPPTPHTQTCNVMWTIRPLNDQH